METMETITKQGQTAEDLATKTAAALGMTAGYLQSHDMQEMFRDVEEAARRNPMPALIGAAAFGVLIGAYLRRS
jgi:hypothetical protein